MIRLVFDNDKKTNKLVKKFKKKKTQSAEICMILAAMYVITKVVVRHELEITELKKTIEEISSKGV